MFKPYFIAGIREENDGKTYKIYEVLKVTKRGKFMNRLLRKEKYMEKEICRVVIGYIEEE